MVGAIVLVAVPMFAIGSWLWWGAGAPTLDGIFGGGFWWYLPTPFVGIAVAYGAIDKVFRLSEIDEQAYMYNKVRKKARERRESGVD
jgi:hypothetical protein